MFITADTDFNQIFIMFIMKTELLVSLLCVSLSVSAAAVVPVDDVIPENRAYISIPVVPVEDDVPEDKADVSVPVVEVADIEDMEAKGAASDDTIEFALEDPLQDQTPRDGALPPVIQARSRSYCSQGWHSHQDSCYLLVNMTYTWNNAEFLCESLGSSLASAHNVWEYSFLQHLTWKAGFLTAWMGGYRFQGYWRWDDATPFNYNNWYYHTSSGYDCVHLNSQGQQGWSSASCSNTHSFICSYKLGYCANNSS